MARLYQAMGNVQNEAIKYLEANGFINRLNHVAYKLSGQQSRTLKEQALNGDIEGAEKGLKKLVAGE